ncbi:MAG: carboxypeptidase regulatory-like domain-containing protein, partial [Bacteroidia bacterium]|nr:carboxypeptidase regulatory-like domain-containing protein [Bacteroidia bacterium]
MKKKLHLILFSIAFLSNFAIWAQQNSLSGIISDNGEAINQVSVQILNSEKYTITDSLGQFEITNLPIGIIQVKFSIAG